MTEVSQGHVNRHLAYPPQTDGRITSIYQHLFTSTAHVQHPEESTLLTHNIDDWKAGDRHALVAATPPSFWDVPGITLLQGATEEISDTFSLTREQMTLHTGAVNKKRRLHSFWAVISGVLCRTQHHNTTRWTLTATYRTLLQWQHIITQILQMIYWRALDGFSLPFSHKKKHPQGGKWRHNHQTTSSIRTEANSIKILSQPCLHLRTLVCCFSLCLPPHFPLSAFLMLFLRYFIDPFLHWPTVISLTPPVWCRFGSVFLWTDSPLWHGANVLLCGQITVSWNWASYSNF